jgi:hypothetical protein
MKNDYRLIRCSNTDCDQIIGYNNYRNSRENWKSLCFECLVKKTSKEYAILKIKRNKLFSWND